MTSKSKTAMIESAAIAHSTVRLRGNSHTKIAVQKRDGQMDDSRSDQQASIS